MSVNLKSNGVTKNIAEVGDISRWPTQNTGQVFYPGTLYTLGARASVNYTLAGGEDGSQWFFTFESPATATTVTHPADVDIYDFEVEPNSHVEISILQIGSGESATKELLGVCKEKSE